MSGLVKLVTVANEIEAEIVRSFLKSNGIESTIREPAVIHFPTSPFMREVFVQEEDFELARRLLDSFGIVPG
ncbi:MAG TPA: DUF2007 domain-containing protein [Anaerolineae bacterium]|nr:DUF2007 domain-containing protein [Anaerolineae bacterium]